MYLGYFRTFGFFATLTVLVGLPSPSSAQSYWLDDVGSAESDVFPYPPELQNAVQFWRQVFGAWPGNQVVLHDNEHLGAIYETVHLPPPWRSDGLTFEQSQIIKYRRAALEDRLSAMEYRLRHGFPLDGSQQRLYDEIVKAGGKFAAYGAAGRVRPQRGMRDRFLEGLRTSGRYHTHIRDVFRNAQLPEDLAYLPHIESSFMANARSSVGAAGVWQFMRSTGVRYLTINDAVDERYDPIFAARGAARYLGGAYQRLGDWGLAITSYNHGINGMAAARREFGPDIGKIVRNYKGRLFGFASRNFYAEFLAVRSIIHNLDQYFPGGVRFDRPLDHGRVRLMYPATLGQLASHYGIRESMLQSLNPALTLLAANGRIPLPAGTEIWMPKQMLPDTDVVALYTRTNDTVPSAIPRYRMHRTTASPVQRAAAKPLRTKLHRKKPSKRSKTHVVRRGESAYGIASRYGVRVNTMMVLNDLPPNAIIRPGQHLRIPEP